MDKENSDVLSYSKLRVVVQERFLKMKPRADEGYLNSHYKSSGNRIVKFFVGIKDMYPKSAGFAALYRAMCGILSH